MKWLKDNTPVDIVPSVHEYIIQDAKEVNKRSWRGLDAKEGLDILMREGSISKSTFKSAIDADQASQSTALLNSHSDVSDSKMDLRTNIPLYRHFPQDDKYEITNYGKLVHTCLHADSEINLLFYGALRRNGSLWYALGQHKEIERHDTFPGPDVIQLAADTIRNYQNSAQYHLQPVS